jgi:hypothetical protein
MKVSGCVFPFMIQNILRVFILRLISQVLEAKLVKWVQVEGLNSVSRIMLYLGCDAASQSDRNLQPLRINKCLVLLKIKVTRYQNTRRHVPQNSIAVRTLCSTLPQSF